MIVTRTPLRVSFIGGGSDLPAFLQTGNRGAVVSAAIDRYVYVTVSKNWRKDLIRASYSRTEVVVDPSALRHDLIRESILSMEMGTGLEITSVAEIPGKGTGLGSSSSYTVGLIHALGVFDNIKPPPVWLADMACRVEIDRIGKPIGKQDQYAVAFGGINYLCFNPNGKVDIAPLMITKETIRKLRKRLILFHTKFKRWDDGILREQASNLVDKPESVEATKKMVGLAFQAKEALEKGSLDDFGCMLNEAWKIKRTLSAHISNPDIDDLYDRAMSAGAYGGKICGAGGGGFMLVYVPTAEARASIIEKLKLRNIDVNYGVGGSQCVMDDREMRNG